MTELTVCPPSLTLPPAGGGKRWALAVAQVVQGASLPPSWGRAGVGGLVA